MVRRFWYLPLSRSCLRLPALGLAAAMSRPEEPQEGEVLADRGVRSHGSTPRLIRPRMDDAMIMVTRHNGSVFALNPDLIERVEANPDTVVSLVGGTKYIVVESLQEIISAVIAHRAEVLKVAAVPVIENTRSTFLRSVSDLES